MNRDRINLIIKRYPFLLPKLYVFIRSLILPVSSIDSYIPSKGKILDVGCGYGLVGLYLSLSSPGRVITGTDINSHRISVAKSVTGDRKNLRFMVADLIPSGQLYDCILGVDLFHHLTYRDKQSFAKRCRQSLSNNGILILKEIDPSHRHKYLVNLIHDKIATGFRHLEYWPSEKMLNFFSFYGFKIISETTISHPLYPHKIYVFQ